MKLSNRQKYGILACFMLFLSFTAASQENPYVDSLEHALSGASSSEDSLRLVCQLAWDISTNNPERTRYYAELALSLSEKTGDPRLLSEAYDAVALGYWVTKETQQAERYYKKSLALGVEYQLNDRIAWSNYNLAQIAMTGNDRASAIHYVKESQKAFKEAGMDSWYINSHWLHVKLLSGDEHRMKLQEMVPILEAEINKTEDKETLLAYYLNMASLYTQLENHRKSLEYVLQALELAESSDSEKGLLSAYSSIGEYLRDIQHNQNLALQYYQRTLEMYRKNNLMGWGVTDALIEIGRVYKAMPDDSMAMEYFSQALTAAEQMNSTYFQSVIYNAMGEIHRENKAFDKALEAFLKSYTIGIEYANTSDFHSVIINLGKVYSLLNEPANSYTYYRKSLALADSIQDSQLRAVSYLNLGEWYTNQGDLRKAEEMLIKAEQNAEYAHSLTLQISSMEELSIFYQNRNQYQKAYYYQSRLRQLEDSLRLTSETDNLARLENLFELQNLRMQKELDRAIADARIEKHVLIQNFFLAGFILMTLLGIYFFINFNRKRKANTLLAKQKRQIEEMSEQMHEVDEMKLQFFTNISHELRTPLTLITGLAEQLTQADMDPEILKTKLETIHKNASRLHLLVNQILDIRKLDNGGSTLQLVRDDLVKYVAGIVAVFRDHARRKGIELVFVSGQNSLITHYDFDKLDKILSNLLSNAINFCEAKDTIRVTLFTKSGTTTECILEVDDTGKGIPSDQLRFIFQPFYQASNAQGGSGLGLALVRELVRVLNGRVEVDSRLDKGTRFTVYLPLEKIETASINEEDHTNFMLQQEPSGTPVRAIHSRPSTAETPDERSLLIVEDNADLQDFIADILKDEFHVYHALDGETGIEMALKYIPDIIISDIMMPGTDGIQLCEKLKKTDCTSHIPILMLTAKTDQESMLKSFNTGADDYIIKPFSAELLKTRIRNLVEQRAKLIRKFSQQFTLSPTEIILPDADKKFLSRIISLIEENISESDLDIDFLASEMHVSRTQLYRKLKALTDLSGNQFIRTIRLKRAAQLLAQKQLSISEVMQETGFSNYSHFNACFREQFRKTPREFVETAPKE